MKILLQQTNTGLYLENSDTWTKEFDAAMDFGNTETAFEFAKIHRLENVQIIAAFPGKDCIDVVCYPVALPPPVRKSSVKQTVQVWPKPIRTPFPA